MTNDFSMDAQELKNIWQAYDQKLERSLALNLHCVEAIQTQKAKSKLNSLILLKAFAVVAGIAWILFLGTLTFGVLQAAYHSFTISKLFFILSTSAIALLTLAGVAVYVKHIVWILQINYSENVMEIQEKTAALQISTIQIARLLFLQLPFYVTWLFRPEWLSNLAFWLVYLPVLIVFAFSAIWLYRNISVKNVDKKWFKTLFDSPEWTSPAKALKFLQEIDEFRKM